MSDVAVRSQGVVLFAALHESLARATGWRAMAVAMLLGAFSSLAFAPFHATPVLIISYVGLVWMIDGARGQKRWGKAVFARGWGFAFGFFIVSLYWTAAPFLVEPEKHAVFIWMPLVLLPGGMALIWGATLAMGGAFWSSSPSRIFIFSFFFLLGEAVRGNLFGGFPWNLPGTSWIPGGAVSQAAAIGGVYWLSLLTVVACAAPAALVDTRKRRGLAIRLLPTAGSVILFAMIWTWGAQRISQPAQLTEHMVVLMDAGIPQEDKFSRDGYANPELLRTYLKWLQSDGGAPGDIIVWPEGAIGTLLLDDRQLAPTAEYLGERTLIAGTTRQQSASGGGYEWFNSLVVLGDESALTGASGLYDKHRLVPVGELAMSQIVPFGEAISGILPGALQRIARNGFSTGLGPAIVYGDDIPPFIPMICYEALYPQVARRAQHEAGHRADWLVVVSNDAWFGAMIGPAQHYAQNRYRAIETGLPMVRVASRGASAIIDGYGREVARAQPVATGHDGWRGRYLRGPLPAPQAQPLFQWRGASALFPLTLILIVVLAFFSWRR